MAGCLVTGDSYDWSDPPPQQGDVTSVLVDPVPVLRVIDGDTIEVKLKGVEEFVRLKGIDTPELHPAPTGSPAEPFAEAARTFTQTHIGTEIDLVFDSNCANPPDVTCRDTYDRLLAYVRISNGNDHASELLRRGLAELFIFNGENFDKRQEYQQLESEARAAGVGIWGP